MIECYETELVKPEVQRDIGKGQNRTHTEVNTSKMDLLASYDDDGDKSQSSNTNKQDQVRFGHRVNDIFYTCTSYFVSVECGSFINKMAVLFIFILKRK